MSDVIIEQAYAFLRGHSTADLRFDENFRELKYVISPDGRLIAPVMVAMLRSVDTVLFVPDYSEESMELQVTLMELNERGPDGAAADRWRIYHGEPPDVRWAFMSIDAVRFGEMVIDGQALTRDNPLAKEEGAICRQFNQNHGEALRDLCARIGGMDIEQPVMVGVDPLGIDVRARFDIVRVPANHAMTTADQAIKTLLLMAADACQP